MTLRQFIEERAKKQDTSLNQMALLLGYKSPNSLYRILDENVRESSLKQFRAKMLQVLQLTPDEIKKLDIAIDIKLHGQERSDIYAAIERFTIHQAYRSSCSTQSPFTALYDHFLHLHHISITLFNSISSDIVLQLQRILNDTDAVIEHYLYQPLSMAQLIDAYAILQGILFHSRYMGYARKSIITSAKDGLHGNSLGGLAGADVAYCTAKDEKESPVHYLITFFDDHLGIYPVQHDRITIDPENYTPLKRKWSNAKGLQDYIEFCRDCAALDYNHSVYLYKPDLCFGHIKGNQFYKLMLDGPMSDSPGFDDTLELLRKIYNDRFNNNMTKRKHCYSILSKAAMMLFARTGRLSDHFWAMRSFTPQERREVLLDLKEYMNKNSHLHFLFLQDDTIIGDHEIDLYEEEGILIQSVNTEYKLEESHSQILFSHPELMYWYREYFLNVLIKKKCHQESYTSKYFDYLISICNESK